jgi:uncharacterized protein (TIGR02099 family)
VIKKSLVWLYSAATYLLWAVIIVIATVVLGLRYYVLPGIQEHKDAIAQEVSRAAGQKITIGSIRASWDGMHPHLDLRQVALYDAQDRLALSLDHVETSLSWLSLALGEPRLATLVIHQPRLTIRRELDGTLYVAGISMSGPSRPEIPNWLLRQSSIQILDASVVWQDDLRRAPPLALEKLTLHLSNPAWESLLGRHKFGLRATPSAGTSRPIDIRGNLIGKDVSRPEQWRGTVYAKLEGTDMAAWRTWLPLPFDLQQGHGATQLWLHFDHGRAQQLVADVALANVTTRLGAQGQPARFDSLSGRLSWQKLVDGQQLRAEKIRLTAGKLEMRDGNVQLRERKVDGKIVNEGDVRLSNIGLEPLAAFVSNLPLAAGMQQTIQQLAPQGQLQRLALNWKGAPGTLGNYDLSGQFSNLAMAPYQGVPGFSRLNGTVQATQDGGSLDLKAGSMQLEFKDVLRLPIPLDSLSAQASWKKRDGNIEVSVPRLDIASPHLAGTLKADYQYTGSGRGTLDLSGKFSRADGRYAHFYYPLQLSRDTLHWLDTSILQGRGENVDVTVRGNLDEFPFADGKRGLFQISAKISDGALDYASGWPKIDGIRLDLLFRGNRMELNASNGNLFGNRISRAKVVIPQLDALHPVLEVTGEVLSPADQLFRFINNSPVLGYIDHFTEGMTAGGSGKLLLGLRIPLDTEGVGSKVRGSYMLSNGRLEGGDDFPKLENINGRLSFTESGVRAQNINAQILGGPAQFSLENGKDGLLRVTAQGRISDSSLREIVASPLVARLKGSADWSGEINLRKRAAELSLRSSLVGLASSLPPPFDKTAAEPMPLLVEKKNQGVNSDLISVGLGKQLSAQFLRSERGGKMVVARGTVSLGGSAAFPSRDGIALSGNLEHLDFDQWQPLLSNSSGSSSSSGSPGEAALNVRNINLTLGTLDIFGRRINQLNVDANSIEDGWRATLQSREIDGNVLWAGAGNGKIVAQLKSLIIPAAAPPKLSSPDSVEKKIQEYPALDISAESFEYKQKPLGRFRLLAKQQDSDWIIDKLAISNPDSTLMVDGTWQNWKFRPDTKLNLNWDIANLGNTLDRFGYPDTLKNGSADLSGQLKWAGSPHEFNVAGLSGTLQLSAKDGQFLKIKPGVGRLFSVLSLQNLPRRLSFDFRDVFSTGFTFDTISANVRINDGIMRSDNFRMDGPTAKVAISGETNLERETQNLHIKVTPSISDSLSLAAFAGGPAVGVAAYVAQKLLKDPLNQMAAYEYDITGTWDEPQEAKSRRSTVESAAPQSVPGK